MTTGAPVDPKSTLVGVVGAGNMGAGIAQKYATEGFPVVVVDVDAVAAARGKDRVVQTLEEGVARKVFTAEQRDAVLGRMQFTADRDALRAASLIVEAVFEDLGVKRALFQDLDARCGPATLLGTNTSSFTVDEVAEGTKHPERVLGLHYFYHPAKNRLVEVIGGTKTSADALSRAWAIQERAGKTPIASKDAPGFVVNRFFVPWLNEAMRLVEDGIADIATVEAAAKESFGIGMGPFALMNVTGVPITLHAATTLGNALGAFYAPASLIRPYVEEKRNFKLDGAVNEKAFAAVSERLWAVVFAVAAQMTIDEGVCTAADCDLGARVGLRWPVGPFEQLAAVGPQHALAWVEALKMRHPTLVVPRSLVQAAKENRAPQVDVVDTRVDGGVGFLTIRRPDAMNALSEAVFRGLDEGFQRLERDPAVQGIVIEGAGKAFVAGADVRFFVKKIEAKKVDDIVAYAASGQEIFRRIDLCKKPVVCKLHGLSLGGGTELALACDVVVAGPRGTMGFPETGIGIYPGLGGTQRTARRVGVPLARWLVLTGAPVDAKLGLALGMIDEVVDDDALDAACRRHAKSGKTQVENAPPVPGPTVESLGALPALFALPLSALLDESWTHHVEKTPALETQVKRVRFKAPKALEAADTLLQAASSMSLADGLKQETAGLKAIFSTDDALVGMKSVTEGTRPAFTGR